MRKSSSSRARKQSVTNRSVSTCIEALEIRRLLATITVNSTANTITPNDASVTLAEAITAINLGSDLGDPNITAQNPGTFGTNDTINFNIPRFGVQVIPIENTDWLPQITQPVTIDGYSQPGASPATSSTPATIEIQLDGNATDSGGYGLSVAAPNVTIKGLSITHFKGDGGIVIEGANADHDVIAGNYIGIDPNGTTAEGNGGSGVYISSGPSFITIGGTTAADRNVISGNLNAGVHITSGSGGTNASNKNDFIEGNYIGTDATGTTAIKNVNEGVLAEFVSLITVGGTDAGAGNLISGNVFGVHFSDTDHSTIQGNFIGTDAAGENAIGNGGAGVLIDNGSTYNTVGGTTAGARNLISGMSIFSPGVQIAGTTGTPQTSNNIVEGNYIGTDITGAAPITYPDSNFEGARPSYGGDGVYIGGGATNNTIGGTTASARNIISGNLNFGAEIGDSASQNVIEGNFIGTDLTGTKALSNGNGGVGISFAPNNLIGGTSAGARNIISGNDHTFDFAGGHYVANGIQIEGQGSTGTVVAGNYIGTDVTGTAALGNSGSGVRVIGLTSGSMIGGPTSASGNVIAYNGLAGVEVSSTTNFAGTFSPTNITIQRNSIYNNVGLGIDLDDIDTESEGNVSQTSGITPNDVGDADTGPNDYQNFPVIVAASYNASTVTVSGAFNSLPNTIFTLDFYANDTIDPSGNGEGKQWIGAIPVLTDANGNALYSGTFNAAIGGNKYISSTATNISVAPYGETSEFSQTVEAANTTPPPPPVLPTISIGDVSMNEGNSGTTAFTFTVTRSGDLSGASSVAVATSDGSATVADGDYLPNATIVNFAAGDASEQFTVQVNGDTKVEADETFSVVLSSPIGATFGTSTATGTIKNDDTQPPPPPSNKVSIITDPCDSSKKAVEIFGTSGNDTISITKSGSSQGKVVVKINGSNKGTYSFSGSILVYGYSGNDNISIAGGITRSAWVWAGDGKDTVNGGGGNDLILGQGEDDSLNGNGGRDILVGGDGTDKLNGGSGDDVLIAGDFKSTPTMAQLCSIQKEWTRTDKNYTYRVKHLTTGGGYNTIRLNSSTLFSSTTLQDSLTGGSGSDLFFAAVPGDVITDKASGETVVDVG